MVSNQNDVIPGKYSRFCQTSKTCSRKQFMGLNAKSSLKYMAG